MSRRTLGLVLVASGAVLIVAGLVVLLAGGSPASESTPTTVASSPTTVTTTPATTPTTAATTTTAQPTTTVESTTTTAVVESETVEVFVVEFAAALAGGETDFVLSRLHPDVVAGYGAEACETWVTAEIMGLSDYRLTGDPTGPSDRNVTIAGETTAIADMYTAPVSFDFGGQSFDATADFAAVDGLIYWVGTCG